MTQINKKFLIVGNWKMNKTLTDAVDFIEELSQSLGKQTEVNIAVCAPFTCLAKIVKKASASNIAIGAQNMHPEPSGAFTGEISAAMLRDIFVSYVILGHSERRLYFNETDDFINKKILAALNANLKPILCVGETLEEREKGKAQEVIENQLKKGLNGVAKSQTDRLIVAYEPVWAIGTGKTATPELAQEMHTFIRSVLETLFNATAKKIYILYGGSMKADNAQALLQEENIDGGLVGGASLSLKSFKDIIETAKTISSQATVAGALPEIEE